MPTDSAIHASTRSGVYATQTRTAVAAAIVTTPEELVVTGVLAEDAPCSLLLWRVFPRRLVRRVCQQGQQQDRPHARQYEQQQKLPARVVVAFGMCVAALVPV